MSRMRLVAAMLSALAAAPAVAAPTPPQAAAEEPAQGVIGGTFMLQDHRGRVVRDEEFRGKYMLIYFGYTFCPDVCPTGLQSLAQSLDLLGEDAKKVQPLFITVDPERDTAKVLADYVQAFHPDILGLTGPRPFVDSVISKYKVKVAKVPTPGAPDGYTVDHTASLFLMDRSGNYVRRFPHGTPPEDVAADLRKRIQADATQ